MTRSLQPCDGCRRHVRSDERACPFCGARVVASPLRSLPQVGLSRAGQLGWMLLFGAAASACAVPPPPGAPPKSVGPAPEASTRPAPPAKSAQRNESDAVTLAPNIDFPPLAFEHGSRELSPGSAELLTRIADAF